MFVAHRPVPVNNRRDSSLSDDAQRCAEPAEFNSSGLISSQLPPAKQRHETKNNMQSDL